MDFEECRLVPGSPDGSGNGSLRRFSLERRTEGVESMR